MVFRSIKLGEFKAYNEILASFPKTEEEFKDFLFRECVIQYLFNGTIFTEDDIRLLGTGRSVADELTIDEVIPEGVVDTVVETIMAISGSATSEKFFSDLDIFRNLIEEDGEGVIGAAMSQMYGTNFDDDYYIDFVKKVALYEKFESGFKPELPLRPAPEYQEQRIDFERENKEDAQV